MEDFKILTDAEVENLSNKERRDYLKKKKEYENKKAVNDVLDESKDALKTTTAKTVTKQKTSNTKKASPGRPKKTEKEKKAQVTLTLEPDIINKLSRVDEKTYRILLAKYIRNNIDDVVKEMNVIKKYV